MNEIAQRRSLKSVPSYFSLVTIPNRESALEATVARLFRQMLRQTFKRLMHPRASFKAQRKIINMLASGMPGCGGVDIEKCMVQGVGVEIIKPQKRGPKGAILYVHGGAFCVGSPRTHRSITTRLAAMTGFDVWTVDYALAPEQPFPSGITDVITAYSALLARGYSGKEVLIAGDSAGGMLTLAAAVRLKHARQPLPAGLILISPLTDGQYSGESIQTKKDIDPVLGHDWIFDCAARYQFPQHDSSHNPLRNPLNGLPPILTQVGDEEVLLDDSLRLHEHATRCGVAIRTEVYEDRWHVFHSQAPFLRSGHTALQRIADFARSCHVDAR
jgi:acetyl esterase/lipase